jgi:hypothetical protein
MKKIKPLMKPRSIRRKHLMLDVCKEHYDQETGETYPPGIMVQASGEMLSPEEAMRVAAWLIKSALFLKEKQLR